MAQAVRYTPDGREIIWSPLPGSQQLFMLCPYDEVLYEGTRGPGKTDALIMSFAQHVGRGFGRHWRGILFREQASQLDDVIAKTEKWLPRFCPGAKFIGGRGYRWRFPDGEQLLLRHMRVEKDYWKYHGHEYPWVGWEELTNWATSTCYESMLSTNRSSYPGITDEEGNVIVPMPRMYRATCNPFGIGHNWVKRMFIDAAPRATPIVIESKHPLTGEIMRRVRCAIHGTIWENKYLLENDPQYLSNLLALTDKNKRAAWLHGSWDITAGGMFDDLWDADVHVLPKWPRDDKGRFIFPNTDWKVYRAFDWGSARPFSVGWYTIAPDSGVLTFPNGKTLRVVKGDTFRIAEWYGCKKGEDNVGLGLTNTAIAKGIIKREKRMFGVHETKGPHARYQQATQHSLEGKTRVQRGPADAAIWADLSGKGSDETIAKDMSKEGVTFIKSRKGAGSRINGWQKLREMLAQAIIPDHEKPAFYSTLDCPEFNRLFPVLPRDEDNPDDVDSDSEDHNGDEARYFVYRAKGSLSETSVTGR